jgi:choline dehydrogenase
MSSSKVLVSSSSFLPAYTHVLLFLLAAHTSSKGWVRLTGSDPQDLLDINKNQFQTPEDLQDLEITKDAVKKTRALWAEKSGMNSNSIEETWPGPDVQTDDEIRDFIVKNAWGHHVCCTAAIGVDGDPSAVLDKDFKVRGVGNLRVVDASAFPWIPGKLALSLSLSFTRLTIFSRHVHDHRDLPDQREGRRRGHGGRQAVDTYLFDSDLPVVVHSIHQISQSIRFTRSAGRPSCAGSSDFHCTCYLDAVTQPSMDGT